MKEKLSQLAEKVAAYNRGGQHMLDALDEIETKLVEILPNNFRVTHRDVGYVSNLVNSNNASWGPALGYVEICGTGEVPVVRPFPTNWSDSGSWFYLHNDFNVHMRYATRAEIKTVAEEMPDFACALLDLFSEKVEKNHSILNVLNAMVNAIKEQDAEA